MITPEQREAFRRWSEELNKLDGEMKAEEGEAWILAIMKILNQIDQDVKQ